MDLSSVSPTGGTILHSVAAGGSTELLDLVGFRCRFDVNARDRYGLPALTVAAMEGHPGMVDGLPAAGAEPGYRNPTGQTAADHARQFDHEDIVTLLGHEGVHPTVAPSTGLAGPYVGQSPPGRSALCAGCDLDHPLRPQPARIQ